MSRHIDGLRAQFQNDFQQIMAADAKDRPSVRMDVADFFQLSGYDLRFLNIRKQDQAVYFPHPSALLVNGADLPGNHKARNPVIRHRVLMDPIFLFQDIETVFILPKFLL